jgi:hypothetical protein
MSAAYRRSPTSQAVILTMPPRAFPRRWAHAGCRLKQLYLGNALGTYQLRLKRKSR